jgi:hypothetical protein
VEVRGVSFSWLRCPRWTIRTRPWLPLVACRDFFDDPDQVYTLASLAAALHASYSDQQLAVHTLIYTQNDLHKLYFSWRKL